MAPALAAWHFVKIVSCGTSNLTKNNSLRSGAAVLPAEITASQSFWVCFGDDSWERWHGGKGRDAGLGWGKAVTCFCCSMWTILMVSSRPLCLERGKQIKATSLSTKQAWGLKRKRLGRAGGKKRICFSNEQSLEGIRSALGKSNGFIPARC